MDVIQFARHYIRSIDDLQVFIACANQHDRWWDAAGLARTMFIAESRAARALERLARTNLLDIRISDAIRYRFQPGSDDLAIRAAAFSAAYHKSPADIVKLVARCHVSDSVRDFADAFRIKRDDNS